MNIGGAPIHVRVKVARVGSFLGRTDVLVAIVGCGDICQGNPSKG